MIDILSHLQKYVPVNSEEVELNDQEPDDVDVDVDDEQVKVVIDKFHYILFGGDQLTVERATGSQRVRSNECRGIDRLEGLIPVVEDWHAKVCFLKVF
jgi:L1 cell adhesion molecule like protein